MVVKCKADPAKVVASRLANPFASLQQIADPFHISREWVRRILVKANVATAAVRVIRLCGVCSKPLNSSQPKHCSRYCRHKASIAEAVCSNCNKVFELPRGQFTARKKRHLSNYFFCSKVCYGQYFGKNYGFLSHPENINTPKRSAS